MKEITKAVLSVMKKVKGMEKNSKVGEGKMQYNGTKDQDVKEVFNDAMSENGLCILPISIEPTIRIDRWVETGGQYGDKTKQSVFTEVKTKYLLLHISGESIELAGYGHGVDSQDKSAGKATTYALKNCLLYSFLTPVGKIEDTETTHSENIEIVNMASKAKDRTAEISALIESSTTLEELSTRYKSLSKDDQVKYANLTTAMKTKLSKPINQ